MTPCAALRVDGTRDGSSFAAATDHTRLDSDFLFRVRCCPGFAPWTILWLARIVHGGLFQRDDKGRSLLLWSSMSWAGACAGGGRDSAAACGGRGRRLWGRGRPGRGRGPYL